MTSAAQRKGDNFERLIRDYLRVELDVAVVRNRMETGADRGDLGNIPGWTFQLKCYDDLTRSIREGIAGLITQQAVTGTPYGAVIAKRRGIRTPQHQLFIMELEQAIPLIVWPPA